MRLLLTLLLGLLLQAPTIESTIHVLIAADTEDHNIGSSCELDQRKWVKRLTAVGNTLDEPVSIQVFAGDEFQGNLFLRAIEQLEVDPDDMILVFYSGHGMHLSLQQTTFPMLCFEDPIRMAKVIQAVEQKKPRFSLLVADSCNSYDPGMEGFIVALRSKHPSPEGSLEEASTYSNYSRLFLESTGMIVMLSCSEGETSLSMPGGGLFTTHLLDGFDKLCKREAVVSWEAVFERATRQVDRFARQMTLLCTIDEEILDARMNSDFQHPQIYISK